MKRISRTIYPAFALVVFTLFALSAQVQAVVPPPNGNYPNGNMAEGPKLKAHLTTRGSNIAFAF
jgi:hypothetical protein